MARFDVVCLRELLYETAGHQVDVFLGGNVERHEGGTVSSAVVELLDELLDLPDLDVSIVTLLGNRCCVNKCGHNLVFIIGREVKLTFYSYYYFIMIKSII